MAQEHDIPTISDEVICGFGRTGEWFGAETLGLHHRAELDEHFAAVGPALDATLDWAKAEGHL